ncbi:TlpA disulfide reductase family protein [Marinifilum sp. D714]|uniref:TlpA disulfide reductase family protein n=1 Tax=Marinifilum sp. D714 TaxID=2937523 RepID=UPI0027C9B00E|nr:TlpA disulfide reductase family protein [Marinifilum sp. D714]MDQ2178469.1 AhpC/TSA family protein [Marinifilum sp. D714]
MSLIKIFTAVCCILLLSCSQVKTDGFKISGKTNYLGKVYLNETKGYQLIPIDSVNIEMGEFVFTGSAENCEQYFLTFEKKKGAFGFFLSNEKIAINISDEHPYFSKITKSPLNIEYQGFTNKMNELVKKQSEERKKYYAEKEQGRRDSLLTILQNYGKGQIELAKQTFESNKEKPYASAILANYLKNYFSHEQLDSIVQTMSVEAKSNKITKQLIVEIEAHRKSAEGQPYINIAQNSPEGKVVSLKEVVAKNKCVLIDFWASWCSPCIASLPEMKEVYAKYKDQGFEIYAVSIDSKKENWLKAINKHELSWIHVSDLKGWDTQAKTDYAVNGVPTTILINKDGIIVAKNMHGKELEDKIVECLE